MRACIQALKRIVEFVKSVLSESDGTGSASRVAKLSIVFVSLACLGFVVWCKKDLPTPDQLKALAVVIGAGATPYAVNQLRRAFAKNEDPPPDDKQPDDKQGQ